MRIFVATDLHGSAYWAEQIVQKAQKEHADVLVLLGDIYNHGPRNPFPQDYAPLKVAEILAKVADRTVVVRGNCDSEVDQMISPFTFVDGNVIPLGGRKLFFTHGHVYNKNNLPKLHAGDAMFYGHFHLSEITEVDGITCVNVGSCALPKDNHSAYCIVDEKGIEIWDFDGTCLAKKAF